MKGWHKKAIIAAVAFVLLVVFLEFLMQAKVHNRQERELSKTFLRNNNEIIELVGNVKDVTYIKEGVDVTFYKDRVEGVYRFRVDGANKTEEVSLFWSTTKGKETTFNRIETSNPWQQAKVIWVKQ